MTIPTQATVIMGQKGSFVSLENSEVGIRSNVEYPEIGAAPI